MSTSDEGTLTFGRCGECGGSIELQGGPGRTREYIRGVVLAVPPEFKTPVCSNCGEEYMVPEISERLDAVLQERVTRHVNYYVERIQHQHDVSQQDIEDALGVTRSYVSHLRAGRKEPSAPLLKLLHLCACIPDAYRVICDRMPFEHRAMSLFVVGSKRTLAAGEGFRPLQHYAGTYEAPADRDEARLTS